jgi:hypothetical protein
MGTDKRKWRVTKGKNGTHTWTRVITATPAKKTPGTKRKAPAAKKKKAPSPRAKPAPRAKPTPRSKKAPRTKRAPPPKAPPSPKKKQAPKKSSGSDLLTSLDCARHAQRLKLASAYNDAKRHHRNLLVDRQASAPDIAKACKIQKIRYHPDRYKCATDHKLFQMISDSCDQMRK